MPLPALEAHVVCAALVAADIIARALRLRAILRGLGQEVPFARLVALTLTCDAACALTPYRAGGDPARVGALTRAGVPWKRAVAALVAEATVMWPVTLAVGGLLAAWGGATWWRALASGAAKIGPVVWPPSATLVFVLATSMAAGAVALRRLRRRLPGWTRAEGRGRLPISPRLLLATAALTLVTVSARVLVLPVLLSAGSETTSLGAALAGSFALLYCQLLLPTVTSSLLLPISYLSLSFNHAILTVIAAFAKDAAGAHSADTCADCA